MKEYSNWTDEELARAIRNDIDLINRHKKELNDRGFAVFLLSDSGNRIVVPVSADIEKKVSL